MEESLKKEIIQWNYEKLITEVIHHSRAPLHASLSCTELLSVLNKEAELGENEEIQKVILNLRRYLENVKLNFEILQTWAENNIKKE